ncbi:MAG: hypothetical protein AABW88_01900 [Nanoarchaeota archaeon]
MSYLAGVGLAHFDGIHEQAVRSTLHNHPSISKHVVDFELTNGTIEVLLKAHAILAVKKPAKNWYGGEYILNYSRLLKA